jgi:hypothetical protein
VFQHNSRNITSALIANVTYFKAVPYLKRFVVCFPPQRPGFVPRSGHVGFVVDKVALGQVFSKYFGFPSKLSFHRLSTFIIYHPGLEQ